MSARKLQLAWGALVGASAFTALAIVALPRRGPAGHAPAPLPMTEVVRTAEALEEQAADSSIADSTPVEEALTSAPEPEPVVAPVVRRAPAAVTTVPDARRALNGVLEGARGLTPVALADAAVAFGPELVPSLLEGILGRGEWPEGEHAPTGDLRVAALRDAWDRYEPALRAQALVECATASRDERRVLVELAGELGGELALPTVLRLAREFEPADLARAFVCEPVERALALALVSSRAGERSLEPLLEGLPAGLASTLVRSWALCGDARGPALAARALGRDPALDVEILSVLAQPSCPARTALGERSLAAVRRSLRHDDPRLRRCAAAALGNVRDTQSVEDLVAALEDVDALVRAAARDSLRAITGRDLGGEAEAWKAWSLERREWIELVQPRELERARGGDCVDAMEALEALLARPDAQDELVDGLSGLLEGVACDAVASRARSALVEIGSARALSLAGRADG